MKIANQILHACALGKYPIVKDKGNLYSIFSPHPIGNYRNSGWYNTQNEAERYLTKYNDYSSEELEQFSEAENWQIIGYYEPKRESFKVGDKVKILDSIQETDNWKYLKDYFPNMKGVIEKVLNEEEGLSYRILDIKSFVHYISHDYLVPDFDDDNNTLSDEEIIITADMVGKKVKVIN